LRNLGRELAKQEGGSVMSHANTHDIKNMAPMIKVSIFPSSFFDFLSHPSLISSSQIWFWMEARSWMLNLGDQVTMDAFIRCVALLSEAKQRLTTLFLCTDTIGSRLLPNSFDSISEMQFIHIIMLQCKYISSFGKIQ
jgi:hypothetical protein